MVRWWVFFAALACFAQASAARNACQLLPRKDFKSVTLTTSTRGDLAVSQCFYQARTFANSVSIMMMSGTRDAVGRYWKSRIESGEREEEGEQHVEEVRGVGDDAIWSGNKINGALYVRTGRAILRVSPGGPGGITEKIARSKRLARQALKRL
jgi:hypothetical protein